MSIPRISVAMSVYNNERHLDLAIQSIRDQTFADFEFLIVDDGSTDGSSAIIDAHAEADPRIRVLRQPNRGLVPSLNRLLGEARAPLIARMDGDDIARPERFARQVAFLDAHPDYGVIGTNTDELDDAGNIGPCTDYHPLEHEGVVARLETCSPLCHSSVMMRTAVVRAEAGYRAVYRHCEDYDLWLRLASRTRIGNLPERLMLYRRSPGQVSSRHALALQIGASVAWLAYLEREAGRPDPTEGLDRLPPIADLDALFGREGVSRRVREKVALGVVYSAPALRGDGLDLILDHIRHGGRRHGLWRTVLRLIKFGEPARALRLAAALAADRRTVPPPATLGHRSASAEA